MFNVCFFFIFILLNTNIFYNKENDNFSIFQIAVLSYFFVAMFLTLYATYNLSSLIWLFLFILFTMAVELFIYSSTNF